MTTLAEITVSPGSIIAWLVVGLIAGWFAARVIKGGGYGLIGDVIVGSIGAVIGGMLFGLIMSGEAGFWSSIVVGILGAWFAIAIFRFLTFGRTEV